MKRSTLTRLALLASILALAAIACGADSDATSDDRMSGLDHAAVDNTPSSSGSPASPTQEPPGGQKPADAGSPDASADGGPPSVPPGTCGTANPAKGFLPNVSIKVGAATRTYALSVPSSYDGTKLYPIVIGFHGDGGNGAAYRSSFPIEGQAAQGAIFVWPNGTNNNQGHSFDMNHDPPNNADVALFDAIVASLGTTYCANKARVYVHGMSGGAYFTNQLGRWRSAAVRAIAPQSGGGPFGVLDSDFDAKGGVTLTGPLPTIIVHGLSDTVVNITEGQQSLSYWRLADKSTAGDTATAPSPCKKQNGGTKPVVFCPIPGLNHAVWSGAPAAIWQFFAAN